MQWFEQNLAATDKQFHITLNERTEVSNKRLEELSQRITELDEKRIKDKEEILMQIDATGLELKLMLAEFKVRTLLFIFSSVFWWSIGICGLF